MTARQLLRPTDVADILGLSEEWVLGCLRDGELPGRKIRGRWYVSRPELDAWLLGDRNGRRAEPARRVLQKGGRRQ
jgi:excisionase family DNA binding protein